MARSATTFDKATQPAKRRGKAEKTKLLEALKRSGRTESDFYNLVVEKAFNLDSDVAFKEVLSRIYPVTKSVAPFVEFEIPRNCNTPQKQALAVIKAISAGKIPPDIGVSVINAIGSYVDIEKTTTLKERIEDIEKSLGIINE